MKPNERDIVSMTRDVWSDHMKYTHSLEEDRKFLECLRAAGVYDWEGYFDALDMMYGGEGIDEK